MIDLSQLTEREQVERFMEWLCTKGDEETFDYNNVSNCCFARYLKETVTEDRVVAVFRDRYYYGDLDQAIPSAIARALQESANTVDRTMVGTFAIIEVPFGAVKRLMESALCG